MYASYSKIYNLCKETNAAQTDNKKFIPLNAGVYEGVGYDIKPLEIKRIAAQEYDVATTLGLTSYTQGASAPARDSYRFYEDERAPHQTWYPESIKAFGSTGREASYDAAAPIMEGYEQLGVGCRSCGGY